MNWKQLGEKITLFAPVVGGLLAGPAGATIGATLAKKVGAAPEPDAVMAAIKSMSTEEVQQADRDIAYDLRKAELKSETDLNLAQIGVNKQAAKSPSIFVAGARPAVIWIGASALLYHFLIRPLGNAAFVIHNNGPMVVDGATFAVFPPIDIAGIITIVGALLGFGGKRTYEKIKGVARNRLRD